MATNSLATRKIIAQRYQLPEAVRLELIQQSSLHPGAQMSETRITVIERQRQRFIALHGSDDCGEAINLNK